MVRSGLQHDVIKLYRQGVRNALSKPPHVRPDFLLHWRYTFHHPQLGPRDFAAIEHQLRKVSRTLEMLSEASVQRINVSGEMREWWAEQLKGRQEAGQANKSANTDTNTATDTTARGDAGDHAQWGHTLPGHGGT